jgi:hypothetical protein
VSYRWITNAESGLEPSFWIAVSVIGRQHTNQFFAFEDVIEQSVRETRNQNAAQLELRTIWMHTHDGSRERMLKDEVQSFPERLAKLQRLPLTPYVKAAREEIEFSLDFFRND